MKSKTKTKLSIKRKTTYITSAKNTLFKNEQILVILILDLK